MGVDTLSVPVKSFHLIIAQCNHRECVKNRSSSFEGTLQGRHPAQVSSATVTYNMKGLKLSFLKYLSSSENTVCDV